MNYVEKIRTRLAELGAPLDFNWRCEGIEDLLEDGGEMAECEVCGHKDVRYMHHMTHSGYDGVVLVGCVCAGVLEGNPDAAKERERSMKNRAKRRETFANHEWVRTRSGNYCRKYKGSTIFINKSRYHDNRYGVYADGTNYWYHKGEPIYGFAAAVMVAFDVVDPA